ncbi:hypothetical protein [Halosimplex pelagicum]|uniref:Uncharacterized protein n=1 Tax=Halosimplex pelagicum TaxID=869886 RepID=A0A7D5STX2_9EURY|nr:hypothetical protein [Halosimplex pelagicum]QLH80847.1 hypothetical protein HZS54_03970 [Halosimplex pelagicum]
MAGTVLLAGGVYFDWVQELAGTGTPLTTLQSSGIYLDRLLLLAPLVLLAVVRLWDGSIRIEGGLLVVTGVAALTVPVIRLLVAINYHAVEFVPAHGFHLTILSSLFFVSAGTTALTAVSDERNSP